MSCLLSPFDLYFHVGCFPVPEVARLSIPGAPAFLSGLRILFLSDVHLRKSVPDAKLAALIGLIRAQHADLILLGGDYAETDGQCARFFEALGGTEAPLGLFGVPGNNDNPATLPRYMASAGVQLLKNRAVALELPGGKLQIGGCDEHKGGAPETKQLFSAGGYRILLSHFPVHPDCEADLMLSGHTHGGQINLLGVTPYSLNFEHEYRMLAVRGLHAVGKMQLAVCSGIGVSRLPLRIGARSQMLLLDFGNPNS